MSSSYEPLIPATVSLNSDGMPISTQFDDIYYSGSSPLEQAKNVFLAGNDVPQRWQGRARFTVLETGFGLGHNFLALWDAWRRDPRRCARLHVVSIEAHPFTRDDLAVLLRRLDPSVQALAQQLVHQWPVLTPGIHRLEFEGGALTLTLAFGTIERVARQLEVGFDACFLDGFSPRVNPEMWTPHVFRQLARMANVDATVATWCSAGQVRRDLQSAGFLVERKAGYGAKRHRISGRLRPHMGRQPPEDATPVSVAIVGSGFAGAAAAHALASRGHSVTVFDPALSIGTAGTHYRHRKAAMTPALSPDDDIRARLSRTGVMLAARQWRDFAVVAQPRRCGTFEPVAQADQERWQHVLRCLQFPADYVCWVDAQRASELTGVHQSTGGVWHAYGHELSPEPLLSELLGAQSISLRNIHIERIARNEAGQWLLYNRGDQLLACTDWVVIANSWLAGRMLSTIPGLALPRRLHSLHAIAGQLSYFSATLDGTLKSVLSGDGLCLPDGESGLIGGSTYVSNTTLSIITEQGHHENRKKVMSLLDDQPLQLGWPRRMTDGWAGWRAAVRDRLPIIGPVATAPGLWLACGFGSRGLTWSALNAELLAARLNHEPMPLERGLLKKIAP